MIETLKIGDKVALAATARKTSETEIRPAVSLLESWGLQVVVPEGLFESEHQFAGSDRHRTALFQSLIDDPEIKAVFCVRGGYGTVRMVDGLCWERFVQHPKWIVGYSDVTVLHSHIHQLFGVPTLHATMPVNIPEHPMNEPAVDSMRAWLFDEEMKILSSSTHYRAGSADAEVVGGNLSILYSLNGTDSDLSTDGKILFIEDLDEYLYHIDRMMQNLKRSGKLSHLKGLIVGAMSDMHDNATPFGKTAEEIVWEAVEEYGYPVAMEAPFGHIGMANRALPLGVRLHFEVSENGVFCLKNLPY